MFSILARSTATSRDGWRPKPQDGETQRRSSPTTRAQSAIRSRIFFDRFDPIAAFVDDASRELHVFRHSLERLAFDPLEEVFDLECGDIDDAVEALQNVDPRRAVQRMRNRPSAEIAVAKMQRPRCFDAFEAWRDQVGRFLRCHHSHIDFAAEDRSIELHIRAAFVGHGAQLLIDDFRDRRHLRLKGVELIAAGYDHLVGGNDRGLAHATGQFLLPPKSFQVAETIGRADLADDLGVGHVVIVEDVVGLRLVDFEPGQALVHMQNEIVGVVFTTGPFIETEIALLRDGFGGRPVEDGLALRRRQFAGMIAGQILLHFGMKPPRSDDSRANGHFQSSHCCFVSVLVTRACPSPAVMAGDNCREKISGAAKIQAPRQVGVPPCLHAQLVFALTAT